MSRAVYLNYLITQFYSAFSNACGANGGTVCRRAISGELLCAMVFLEAQAHKPEELGRLSGWRARRRNRFSADRPALKVLAQPRTRHDRLATGQEKRGTRFTSVRCPAARPGGAGRARAWRSRLRTTMTSSGDSISSTRRRSPESESAVTMPPPGKSSLLIRTDSKFKKIRQLRR
jgi:hypothetical protein